jgi:hypothetical protein
MLFWHVPAPNEALLISGSKRHADETQFRIVTGHGSFVMPIKQRARMLSLALREAEIAEECITKQGIRRRRRVQGRRRLRVDRQRGPPLPVRAGQDGDPGRPGVRELHFF